MDSGDDRDHSSPLVRLDPWPRRRDLEFMRAIALMGLAVVACEGRAPPTQPIVPAESLVQRLDVQREVLSADKSVVGLTVAVSYTAAADVHKAQIDARVQEVMMEVSAGFKALDAYQDREKFAQRLRTATTEIALDGVNIVDVQVLKLELEERLKAFLEARARRDQARAQAEAERQRALAEARFGRSRAVTVLTQVVVHADQADAFAADAARYVTARAGAEGRMDALLIRDQERPEAFVLIEQFRSVETMEAYYSDPEHKSWREATAPLVVTWTHRRQDRLVP